MLDDGLLDVRLLPQLPKEEIPEALRILLRDGLEGVRRTLVGARVPWLEIETEESLQINLDGEPLTDTRFRFELLPRRLSMKLPTGCPLLVMLISRAAGAMEQRSSPFRLLASGSVSCCPSGAECPEADAPYTRRMPLRDIFTERADVDLVTLRNLGPSGRWRGNGRAAGWTSTRSAKAASTSRTRSDSSSSRSIRRRTASSCCTGSATTSTS